MEPCTEGKVGAHCWLLLIRVALFVLRKSPSTKRGGCVRNQGPTYPRVWLKHTPLHSRGENRVPLQPIVASQCIYRCMKRCLNILFFDVRPKRAVVVYGASKRGSAGESIQARSI